MSGVSGLQRRREHERFEGKVIGLRPQILQITKKLGFHWKL